MNLTLKSGQMINELNLEDTGMYSIRLGRHGHPIWPRVEGKQVESRIMELGYYDSKGAVENIVIEGPYMNLNGGVIDLLK